MMLVNELPPSLADPTANIVSSKDKRTPRSIRHHESIQDLPVHPFATAQTFVPTSESHPFNRADAAAEFGLPVTDQAVPHPALIQLAADQNAGLSHRELVARQVERDRLEAEQKEERERKKKEAKEKEGTVVEKGRYQWRLMEAETGKVGIRYGVPHQDRKRGQHKVPKRVIVV